MRTRTDAVKMQCAVKFGTVRMQGAARKVGRVFFMGGGRGQRWAAAVRALPEHIEMPMPRLVPTMTYGVISKWLVSEGDYVEVADLVCEIDVQNLTSELPAATCVP